MNGKQMLNLASATVLAGGLFVGSVGWADAQQHRHGATQDAASSTANGAWYEAMADMMPGMMDEMMSHMMIGMMGGMGGDAMTGGVGSMTDPMDGQMQAAVAEGLGLSVDELQAELAGGKTLPQISEGQGVDLADLHEAVMGEFGGCVR